VEQYGSGEAYLPILDGLSRLCRGPQARRVIDLLQQYAPSWLAQMPSVLSPAEKESTQHTAGVSRERMLREMADAVELMSAENPIIFVLEDLHWSDYSTLDLMSFLARHRDPARVMVIGTYRPVEVILAEHRLKGVKQELRAQGLCTELALEYLMEETVAEYLSIRFPGHQFPRRLARLIHKRTEGNPLFMVNVVEYLVEADLVSRDGSRWMLRTALDKIEAATPESLRNLIEKQIERLSDDERTVLEGAAVVGMECSTAAIAAGLERDEGWVEEQCEKLVKRHEFLTPAKVVRLPDGTLTRRHKFSHVLFLEVPYSLIPGRRRRHIHRRIGDRGEIVYSERPNEIAAELAMHFAEGQDFPRAARYLVMAAENAARCSAHHEAAALAWRGLSLLESLAQTSESSQQQMTLQIILGVSVMATKGFASAEAEQVYLRAKELYWLQGPSTQLFSGLWLLGHLYFFRGKIETAMEVSDQMLQLSEGLNDPGLVMQAELAVGATLVELGRCADAIEHLQRASAIYESHRTQAYTTLMGHDCKVISESYAARALWALGYPDRALTKMNRAEELAQQLSHAQSLVAALHFGAELHLLRGESSLARSRAEALVALAEEYGLELWLACGNVDLGWAEIQDGHLESGIDRLRRGLDAQQATGASLWKAHFLSLLASALARTGNLAEGLSLVQQAIGGSEESGESYFLAELHRVKGEILLMHAFAQQGARRNTLRTEARSSLDRALTTAKQQQTRSWELRAVLSRQFDPEAKTPELKSRLRSLYEWFKEGHETSDLRTAKDLIAIVGDAQRLPSPNDKRRAIA
jgi:predicted ATPase